MSPELIQDPKEADLPADIWALGAILFQRFLSGEPPFGTGLKAIPKIVRQPNSHEKPPLLTQKKQFVEISSELWKIVESCLRRDPQSRPTADELVSSCAELCYSISPRFFGNRLQR